MTSLNAAWEELVLRQDPAGGYVRLRIPYISGCALYAARRVSDGLEALIIEVRTEALPGDIELPKSKGFRVVPSVLELGRAGRTRLVLELMESRYSDVFRSLAGDLVSRIALASDERAAVRVLVSQLSKWQAFLRAAGMDGLSVEAQRGLIGELTLLRDAMLGRFGDASVACWAGAFAANHDFQLPGGHLEVKTTVANTPHVFHVSNSGQLDSSNCGELLLCLTSIAESQTVGESLPDVVASIRSSLGEPALSDFDDKLLSLGVLPGDHRQHSSPRYTVTGRALYRVGEGFPRLTAALLPAGVEAVTYTVAVASCAPFKVDFEVGIDSISIQERVARG